MGQPASLRLKVRHHEVDPYGHVNHAHYVHYLESGRVDALEALGLGLPDMQRQGYLIVAVELTIKYHAPAHAGETIEVLTHIREIRGARTRWVQEIREVDSGSLLVTAEVTGAFTSASGRPVRIPAAFVERLAPITIADAAASPGPTGGSKSRP